MRCLRLAQLLVALTLGSLAGQSNAGNPNTDAADSVAYEVDQGWVTTSLESASTNRWFAYGEVGGHSYCVETATGSLSPIAIDTRVDVYSDANGTTPLTINGTAVANDVATGEPIYVDGARSCYIAPGAPSTSTIRLAKISAPTMAGGDTGYVRFRVVETTLFAPSWYASMPTYGPRPDQRYTTYFVISNRLSGTTINVRLVTKVVTGSGATSVDQTKAVSDCLCAPAGPTDTTHGALMPGVTAPANTTGIRGSLMIAHDGPPGAIDSFAVDPATGATLYQLNTRW
jgi:hypothetical protein